MPMPLEDFATVYNTHPSWIKKMNSFIPINENRAKADIIEVGRLAYERQYISGTEGNISIRLDSERILTTPRGVCKGRLSPSDLVVTNLDGELTAESLNQCHKPSTELKMHLTAYRLRSDVRAIVHAHPTTAVAYTVAGRGLGEPILPESILALGDVPITPYATPSTDEVSKSIEAAVLKSNCLIMDHHGSITMGATVFDAYYLLETLEHHAKTLLTAHILGGAKSLTVSQIKTLFDICHVYGIKPPATATKWANNE